MAGHPTTERFPALRSMGQSLLYGDDCVQFVLSQPPVGVVPAGGHCWKSLLLGSDHSAFCEGM